MNVNTDSGMKPNTFARGRNGVHHHPGIRYRARGAGHHNRQEMLPQKGGRCCGVEEKETCGEGVGYTLAVSGHRTKVPKSGLGSLRSGNGTAPALLSPVRLYA